MKETIRLGICIVVLAWVAALNTGCATINSTLKGLFGGKSDTVAQTPKSGARFSETDNVRYNNDLKYKRMNRDRFEEEAEVAQNAGSLWVMEGQGAYLFAQNTTRLVGDILNVRVDGNPKMQLQTKTRVIAKLLARLDRPNATGLRGPASAVAPQANAQGQQQPAGAPNAQAPADPNAPQAAGLQPGQPVAQSLAPAQTSAPEAPFNVESVPTRIVEVMRDGSYRIRGTQDFMIGKREYRVIVTGIVRQEDFNEDGISADKLMDSQFDIVSAKRGATL